MRIKQLFVLALIIAGCEYASDLDDGERLVIEAYLYNGQVGQSIQVSQLVPLLASEDSYAVNTAIVNVSASDGTTYLFELSDEDNGVYVNDEMTINTGLTYELEVQYEDQKVTAEASVPAYPVNLNMESDVMTVTQITDPEELRDREVISIEVNWENDNSHSFFVAVDNLDNNGSLVNLTLPGGGEPPESPFSFTVEPTTLDYYDLQSIDLDNYGPYTLILYSIHQEYVDLYDTFGEDSRSFSEPLTNINNGLGIFTAMSSDTLYFDVLKAEEE